MSAVGTSLWRPNIVKLPPHCMFKRILLGLRTQPMIASRDATLSFVLWDDQFPKSDWSRECASTKDGSLDEPKIRRKCLALSPSSATLGNTTKTYTSTSVSWAGVTKDSSSVCGEYT